MNYYDAIAEGYSELHQEEQLKKLAVVKKLLKKYRVDLSAKTTLLDVGCGSGLSSMFDCEVTGIDPSQGMLNLCKKNNPNMKTIKGVAEELPFEDNSFDIVVSLTAIQNFDTVYKGICEIARVGKQYFVLSVLKKTSGVCEMGSYIRSLLDVVECVEEEKDFIFMCTKKSP